MRNFRAHPPTMFASKTCQWKLMLRFFSDQGLVEDAVEDGRGLIAKFCGRSTEIVGNGLKQSGLCNKKQHFLPITPNCFRPFPTVSVDLPQN